MILFSILAYIKIILDTKNISPGKIYMERKIEFLKNLLWQYANFYMFQY